MLVRIRGKIKVEITLTLNKRMRNRGDWRLFFEDMFISSDNFLTASLTLKKKKIDVLFNNIPN